MTKTKEERLAIDMRGLGYDDDPARDARIVACPTCKAEAGAYCTRTTQPAFAQQHLAVAPHAARTQAELHLLRWCYGVATKRLAELEQQLANYEEQARLKRNAASRASRAKTRARHAQLKAERQSYLGEPHYACEYCKVHAPHSIADHLRMTEGLTLDEGLTDSERAKLRLDQLDGDNPAHRQEIQEILEMWSDVWRDTIERYEPCRCTQDAGCACPCRDCASRESCAPEYYA